jgi:hypothetical protein
MADAPKYGIEEQRKAAEAILDLGDRFERLRDQAERASIGVRSSLARELNRLRMELIGLKTLGAELRATPAEQLDGEYRTFERKRRDLERDLKALQRKLR